MKANLTTAAFITIGLVENKETFNAALAHWDAGCFELVEEAVSYSAYTDALINAGHDLIGDYPGVAEYEVAEEFGAWYVEQVLKTSEAATAPDPEVCCEKLRDLTYHFFTDHGLTENSTLTAILASVPTT